MTAVYFMTAEQNYINSLYESSKTLQQHIITAVYYMTAEQLYSSSLYDSRTK
jgi:hypothetical protein